MIKETIVVCAVTASALVAGTQPAIAHHSVNAEFDSKQEFTLKGVLTRVDNVNPHSWWYVDVTGADGKVTSWKLESQSPVGLIRQGLKVKQDVHVGESYSFRVAPGWKDPEGAKLGFMKAITVNGKEYVMAEL